MIFPAAVIDHGVAGIQGHGQAVYRPEGRVGGYHGGRKFAVLDSDVTVLDSIIPFGSQERHNVPFGPALDVPLVPLEELPV